MMDKLNAQIRLSSNTSAYIVTTSKTIAYNNALSATTSVSPFFANKEYYLNITVHSEHNIASSRACDFVINLDEL